MAGAWGRWSNCIQSGSKGWWALVLNSLRGLQSRILAQGMLPPVVSNVDKPNQDYPLRAFSEVCLREIPGLIQLVTEMNPYSRWSTCSLSLGTWVQIPRAHRKSGAVVCICILSVSVGSWGVEIRDSWEAQGPTGDSVSRQTEREKRWLDCPLTSIKSHDL